MKYLKYFFLSILLILAVLGISVFAFFSTAPQLGANPAGERLDQMKEAANFQDGIFTNSIETNMDMKWEDMQGTLEHYLFADKSNKNPKIPIKTRPFSNQVFSEIPHDSIAFVWLGHSTILLRIKGKNILFDPIINGERASMFSFMGPERFDYTNQFSVADLPEIDIMLLSHDHYDHLDYPSILALKDKTKQFLLPLGTGAHFEHWGISADKIREFEWWQEIAFDGISFAFTPTRHFSGRGLTNRFSTLWGSWCVITEENRFYFSGDSGYFPGFKEIGEKYGPFDLTFMECGAYNEAWSEIHMFPEETTQAHQDLKGKLLMPIHWGKFDLSLHPWKESVNRLQTKAEMDSIDLLTPEIGHIMTLSNQNPTAPWWESYE